MVPHSPAPCGLRMDPQQTHHNRCSKGVTSISSAGKRGPGGSGGGGGASKPAARSAQRTTAAHLAQSGTRISSHTRHNNKRRISDSRALGRHKSRISDALILVVLVVGAAPRSNRVGLLLSGCTRLDGQLLRGIHGHSPPRFCSQQGHRPANQEGVSFESSSP